MLKTSYILFIATLAIGFALAASFSSERRNPTWIGASGCGSCHASRASGSAQIDWQAGPHSDAYRTLSSERARDALDETGALNSCLPCHSTISHEPVGEEQKRIQLEGVGCERCHGPGSEYSESAVMRREGGMKAFGGSPGSLRECTSCHVTGAEDPGPVCPVDSSTIDPVEAWERIGHSRDTSLFEEPAWEAIIAPRRDVESDTGSTTDNTGSDTAEF